MVCEDAYPLVVEADPDEVFVVCEVGVVEPEADAEVVVPEAEAVGTVLPAAAQALLKASIAALVFSPQRLWI